MNNPFKIRKTLLSILLLFTAVTFERCVEKEDKVKGMSKNVGVVLDESNPIVLSDSRRIRSIEKNAAYAPAKKWRANAAKAQIKFTVGGPFGKVQGSLSGLTSTILFDEKDLSSSSISASVEPNTINTGNKRRDRDLQKEKYLNSGQFPKISFRSEKFQKIATGYRVTGNLTIKGITRRVEIPFNFTNSGNNGTFKGQFSIQRADYGIKGGALIGSQINVDLSVPVTKI